MTCASRKWCDMDLHPLATASADDWDRACSKWQDLYLAEFTAARDRLHISMVSHYDGALNEADRSAFAYTIDDYIRRGIPTGKKKGKRK